MGAKEESGRNEHGQELKGKKEAVGNAPATTGESAKETPGTEAGGNAVTAAEEPAKETPGTEAGGNAVTAAEEPAKETPGTEAGGNAVTAVEEPAKETPGTAAGGNAAVEKAENGSRDAADANTGGGNKLISLLTSEGMRYLFIGGCTTLVNLVVYAVLCRVVHLNVNISNIISVSVSILFAYVTNKLIVFRSHCNSFSELAAECARFIGARLATMVIEVGGVFLLYNILHQNEMVAKLATQVLVVIGNYFISRFIVFKDRT